METDFCDKTSYFTLLVAHAHTLQKCMFQKL